MSNQITEMMRSKIDAAKFRRRAIAVSVMGMSAMVMYAWYANWHLATRLSPDWVTMKFVTAFTFFVCGGCILFEKEARRIFLKGFVLATGIYTLLSFGSEISFMPNFEDPATYSIFENYPSLFTILSFMLFGMVGWYPALRKAWGALILSVAGIVMAGYVINVPIMYGYIPGFSTAMAAHSAFLFLHLGFYLLDEDRKKQS